MFKSLSKDILIYGLGSAVSKLILFLLLPLYSRALTIASYGSMELTNLVVAICVILFSMGMNGAVQRYYWSLGNSNDTKQKIVLHGLFVTVVTSVFVFIGALVLVILWKEVINKNSLDVTILFIALIAGFGENIFQFSLDVLRLKFKSKLYVLLSVLKSIAAFSFITLFILKFNLGYKGYFYSICVVNSLFAFCGVCVSISFSKFKIDVDMLKKLVHFGFPLVGFGIANYMFASIDRWMLVTMTDTVQVGLYSFAYKISFLLSLVTSAFGQAWSPFAMRVYGEGGDYKRLLINVSSIYFGILTICVLGIIGLSAILAPLLFDASYLVSIPMVGMLTLTNALQATGQITAFGFTIKNKTSYFTLISLIAFTLNAVCNYLLIPHLGALGAAIATMASNTVMAYLFLYFAQRTYPIGYKLGLFFSYYLLALVASFLNIILFNNKIMMLVLLFSLMAVVLSIIYKDVRLLVKKG